MKDFREARLRRTAISLSLLVAVVSIFGVTQSDRPPWFGIGFSYTSPTALSRDGWLLIQRVAKGSPAEKAGVQERDVVVEINGRRPRFKDDLAMLQYFATFKPGQSVRLTIRRASVTRSVEVIPTPMTDEQFALFKKSLDLAKRSLPRAEEH